MSVLKMQTIHFSTSIMVERSWGSLVGFLNSFPVNATSLTVPSLNCGFLALSGNIDVSSENANHTFFCIHHVLSLCIKFFQKLTFLKNVVR